ncbi:MAG: tRNA (adenosine(37)-N6)-dimethylallyltransferase MiaA [Muribaculaceae bacterium]|nr:tRNA (adenosine(37)-N6)-dimethylallyltransferase MiaA [Muribaculaceae bacterium]
MVKKKQLIVITGPTASGKSVLAIELAKRLQSEIISADSRQIYKGIPIVTAVPSIEEREGIPHHLLEILELDEYYSAARFDEDATRILKKIFKDRDVAIVCGGSMLYLDALTKGIDQLPTVPSEIRQSLIEDWNKLGDDWLLSRLKVLDPDYYLTVDLKNMKRVFHAVELCLTAGKPYSSLLSGSASHKDSPYNIVKFCLIGEREKLFDRINHRVIKMMEAGLEEEARKVYHLRHLNSLNTVGLKEMFQFFDGSLTREEAISRIQKNTRVYAKKQLTWHKRDDSIRYLDFNTPISYQIEEVIRQIN